MITHPGPKRGRPPGSGIDDGHRLKLIAGILSTSDMSITAAIKAIGITDTSQIRRLRDKYKARKPSQSREEASCTRPSTTA